MRVTKYQAIHKVQVLHRTAVLSIELDRLYLSNSMDVHNVVCTRHGLRINFRKRPLRTVMCIICRDKVFNSQDLTVAEMLTVSTIAFSFLTAPPECTKAICPKTSGTAISVRKCQWLRYKDLW